MLLLALVVLAVGVHAQTVKRELITDPSKFPALSKQTECDKYSESLDTTGPICERSCDQPWKMTCYNTTGCRCKAGLFTCFGGCSLYKYCEPTPKTKEPSCGENELFVTATSKPKLSEVPKCEPTCQNSEKTDCPEKKEKLMPQCRCKPGYIRDINVCVPVGKCSK